MFALAANPNPQSNILMSDNFLLLQTQVQLGPCYKISASFQGLCFGLVNSEEKSQIFAWQADIWNQGSQETEEQLLNPEYSLVAEHPFQVKADLNSFVKDIKSISNQTAFFTEGNGELYLIEHPQSSKKYETLKATKQNKIMDISMLEAGANHFLALKQKIRPALRDWTVERVVEWLPQTGFGECANVLKFGKIDGKRLEESLSPNFLSETLGIIGENE